MRRRLEWPVTAPLRSPTLQKYNRKLSGENVAYDLLSENPERKLSVIILRNINITNFLLMSVNWTLRILFGKYFHANYKIYKDWVFSHFAFLPNLCTVPWVGSSEQVMVRRKLRRFPAWPLTQPALPALRGRGRKMTDLGQLGYPWDAVGPGLYSEALSPKQKELCL